MSQLLNVKKLLNSLKGISGTNLVLERTMKYLTEGVRTLDPGDLVSLSSNSVSAAPIAYDLWYLYTNVNFLSNFYSDIDGDHYDYKPYLDDNLSFLNKLPGLRPLRALRDLRAQLTGHSIDYSWHLGRDEGSTWVNNGIYWVNLLTYELWALDIGYQYTSIGPKNFVVNEHIGYISFPTGQLGVMEVVSILHETDLSGYKFNEEVIKTEILLTPDNTPEVQTPPKMFPEMANAGQDYCFGQHLIEKGYLVPESEQPHMECMATNIPYEIYGEDTRPKKWMRYWIPRTDKTIPGEFIGILTKPIACPPHVWWFQESSPFVYSGNWIDTWFLTSGVVTKVLLEEDRSDSKFGNQYTVKVQGCEIVIEATDFFLYKVGDRVSIIKMSNIEEDKTVSFTWIDLVSIKEEDKEKEKVEYIIMPGLFYKET